MEIVQRSGSRTSCTFDDGDVEDEQSTAFLDVLDSLLTNNRRLKRLNIFFPLRTKHLERLAELAMPRIFNQLQLLSFYGLNCETIRHN